MAGGFHNICVVCNQPFKEQDKAVVRALVVVTGGHSNRSKAGEIISGKVAVRFRVGSRKKLVHASCWEDVEQD